MEVDKNGVGFRMDHKRNHLVVRLQKNQIANTRSVLQFSYCIIRKSKILMNRDQPYTLVAYCWRLAAAGLGWAGQADGREGGGGVM